MKKILIVACITAPMFALAENVVSNYDEFQNFKNQYSFTYVASNGNWANGGSGTYTQQSIGLDVEHLSDFGVWMDLSAGLLTSYSQRYPSPTATAAYPTKLTGDQGVYGGINGRLGYAFSLVANTVLFTPYAIIGRNTNISTYTLSTINPNNNITTAYFISAGSGAKVDYVVNSKTLAYLSQDFIYNADQADHSSNSNLPTSSNMQYTTTAGVKYNVTKLIQVGGGAYFTHYAFNSVQIYPSAGYSNYANPNNQFGIMLSAGLTY